MPEDRLAVTFVVPCYNSTEWLGESLKSLQAQTVDEWEAVIVDDGSDPEADIGGHVESLGDPRMRVIRHPRNRGLSAARNTGIEAARAESVICLDSDDLLPPDCLEMCLQAGSSSGADVVFGDFQYFGGIEELVRTRVPSPSEILVQQPVIVPGMFMRKSLWERLGGFDESGPLRLGREDTEFCIRLFHSEARAMHIDRVLYLCRRWDKSLNRSCLRNEYVPRLYIYDKHRRLYDSTGARRPFLTKGFEIAAKANLKDGRRLAAAAAAAESFRYGGSLKNLVVFAESMSMAPPGTFEGVRRRLGSLTRWLRRS